MFVDTIVITQDVVEEWLGKEIAQELGLSIDDIDVVTSFMDMGLSSLATLEIVGGLEVWLGIEIDPSEFWDYPSIELLSEYLITRLA